MRTIAIGFLLACTACGTSGTSGVRVKDLVLGGCAVDARAAIAPTDSGDSGAPEGFVVTAIGPGTIRVEHDNYRAECCLDFRVTAEAIGDVLSVRYAGSGPPCDCLCGYDFDFEVEGLAPGAWTVMAGGRTALVTVE